MINTVYLFMVSIIHYEKVFTGLRLPRVDVFDLQDNIKEVATYMTNSWQVIDDLFIISDGHFSSLSLHQTLPDF